MIKLSPEYLRILKLYADSVERYPLFPKYMIWDHDKQKGYVRVAGRLKGL